MSTFQNLQTVIHDGDLSEHIKSLHPDAVGQKHSNPNAECVVSLFGRVDDGQDVCCHVRGFAPIHDLRADYFTEADLSELLALLRRRLGRANSHAVTFGDVVKRKSNHGFQNGALDQIIPCICANLVVYDRVKYHLRELANDDEAPFRFDIVNVDARPFLRFWGDRHVDGCTPSGWYTLQHARLTPPTHRQTTCDVEYDLSYVDFARSALPEKLGLNPHFKQLCFDIETYTKDRTTGINPNVPENVCICIGATLYTDANGFDVSNKRCFYYPYEGHVVDRQSVARILCQDTEDADVVVSFHDTEKAMLEAFGAFVRAVRPDVILGYNSDSFDFWYIVVRAQITGCSELFFNMSKVKRSAPMFLTASEHQGRQYQRPTICGVFVMDVMIPITNDVTKKYPSYKLMFVVQELLGNTTEKYDLPLETMFHHYEVNGPAEVAEIIKYCMRDVVITQKVATIDVLLNKLVEMSNLTILDVLSLIAKGQTIRCVSLLYAKYTLPEFGYYLTENHMPDDDIAGGHVGEPVVGLFADPVVVFDFKSLYPSIMMAYNLDFTSIVHDPKYLNLPGVEYFESEAIHPTSGRMLKATFAKYCAKVRHVIPTVLSELSAKRQSVKKQMKAYSEQDMTYRALNSIQNAIKVTMNSFYGFIGGHKFPVGAFAQAITGQGRNLIGQCKVLVETKLPRHIALMIPRAPEVIYGDTDSVFVTCPGATVAQAEAFGKQVESFLTTQFITPIEMEYEKMFVRTALVRRKNYMYVLNGSECVKYQGGEQVKRDYCKYFQDAYDVVTNYLFLNKLPDDVRLRWTAFKTTETHHAMRRLLEKNLASPSNVDNSTPEDDYVTFVQRQKRTQEKIMYVLDHLNNKSTNKLIAERDMRLTYQPLPVLRAGPQLAIAGAIRKKAAFASGVVHSHINPASILDALSLFHMYIEHLRELDHTKQDPEEVVLTLESLTSSCRLAGRYHSPKMAAAQGVDKASVSPYTEEAWAVPNLAAVHLARRIRERTPGQEPSVGSRFSYLTVLDTSRRDVKAEQLETVEYAMAHHLPIDLNAYLEKNGMPFQKLFGIVGGQFACGHLLDVIMKQVNDDVNRHIRQITIKTNELAKKSFFDCSAAPMGNSFAPRQLKVSKAKKAKQADNIRPLTDFFAPK